MSSPAIACAALSSGAHVLVEKPAGIGVADIDRVAKAAIASGRLVKVGFNHRFHPGIARAICEARSGIYGDVLYLRARYGHGGRLGYEKEWRADPTLSGGGEIVDQGMHLLDLSYWLLGELPLARLVLRTQFWDAPVDDNAVLLLGEEGGVGSAAAVRRLTRELDRVEEHLLARDRLPRRQARRRRARPLLRPTAAAHLQDAPGARTS